MKVKVRVPATSANLGPGFDVAGLAVTLYNTFVFELLDQGLEITGCPQQFCNQDNLTYRAFVEGAKACGLQFQGLRIECSGDVNKRYAKEDKYLVALNKFLESSKNNKDETWIDRIIK